MKSRILGLLAVGLLAGPITAQAAFVYNLSSNSANAFVLTTPSLISSTTTFAPGDFDSITAVGAFDSVTFFGPLTSGPEVRFNIGLGNFGYFWTTPFSGAGTYCSGFVGCANADAVMTIRETNVPEPGTLALLGIGLAGLGLSRRRLAA